MKLLKFLLVIMAAVVVGFAFISNGQAFHEEGVAYCAGCHTMHNSQDGIPIVPGGEGGYLLRQVDGSSTCLRCHADYGQFAGGKGYGGGGDFYWLTKTFTWSAHGRDFESTGDSHGHNIIARDFGLMNEDAKLGNKAPGGTFDHEMSCASCHDPHGNENYLLLRSRDDHDGADFPDAPIAVSPGRRTASSNAVSDTNHPAYGSGMSEWCAGCHTSFIDGLAKRMHPADFPMSTTIRNQYNGYINSDQPTGGNQEGAYLEMVAFQTGDDDTTGLDTKSIRGPDAGGEVACISCHRAHASAFPDAGRWYFETELLVESHPEMGDGGATMDDITNSYYGKSIEERFGVNQRSLCNKCHGKDGPHGSGGG